MEENTNQNHEGHDTSLVAEPAHKVDETPGLETVKNVASNEVSPIKGGQFRFETWWIIVFLVFALLILKTFIYIKDKKRDGK